MNRRIDNSCPCFEEAVKRFKKVRPQLDELSQLHRGMIYREAQRQEGGFFVIHLDDYIFLLREEVAESPSEVISWFT